MRRALPLRVLHGTPAVTMFDHVVRPPRKRGTTCSNVSADETNTSPQYWQVKRSRRNTLKRVKAMRRAADRYLRSATTDGSRMHVDGLRARASYSATTEILLAEYGRTASYPTGGVAHRPEVGVNTSAGCTVMVTADLLSYWFCEWCIPESNLDPDLYERLALPLS
jgi:hypothetical protein